MRTSTGHFGSILGVTLLSALLSLLNVSALLGQSIAPPLLPIPANPPPSFPSWWFQYGAISPLNSGNASPVWPQDYASPSDFAMVTQGQLKNIAVAAFDELQANLPGGAGGRVTALVEQWLASDGAGNLLYDWQGNHIAAATPNNDFVAVNLGQVKAVAAPFYDRLIQTGYCSSYPWNGPTSDFASVNLGQLKSVFSFDVGADSDQNGLPDWWEMKYFGHILGTNPANIPYGATLISLRYDFTNGIDPTTGFADVYGGNLPSLTMSVGNGQVSSVNRFFKQALAVQVRDASGHPLPNAPVTFSVQQGGGSLADPFTLGQMGGPSASSLIATASLQSGPMRGPYGGRS